MISTSPERAEVACWIVSTDKALNDAVASLVRLLAPSETFCIRSFTSVSDFPNLLPHHRVYTVFASERDRLKSDAAYKLWQEMYSSNADTIVTTCTVLSSVPINRMLANLLDWCMVRRNENHKQENGL